MQRLQPVPTLPMSDREKSRTAFLRGISTAVVDGNRQFYQGAEDEICRGQDGPFLISA